MGTLMKNAPSFYWYDYETFGTRPAQDWPAQFAGVRTDEDFNEIEDPLDIYCRLPNDQLPIPEASLITGLTPQFVNHNGFCEADFIKQINQKFMHPLTCVTGYNNINFDDEITRHSLYRNFLNPYSREWQNGNSRWDLINTVRLCAALRPEGIEWPLNENKELTIKLDLMTKANNLEHDNAHNALSDVRATISLAKLIKQKKTKLIKYVLENKDKASLNMLLDTSEYKPIIHVSGKYSSQQNYMAIVIPIFNHPAKKNEIIVYDLSVNPQQFFSLNEDEINERIYTKKENLKEKDLSRIPVKSIRINRCPIVVTTKVLREKDKNRLNISDTNINENRYRLLNNGNFINKIKNVLSNNYFTEQLSDPDLMLYSGFFSRYDASLIEQVSKEHPDKLKLNKFPFKDKRLPEMLFRYRARNWPETLNKEEVKKWKFFCHEKIKSETYYNEENTPCSELSIYFNKIETLLNSETDLKKIEILNKLKFYGKQVADFSTI